MKKNNKKGFMLAELLVTSTLVCTVLIFLYSQFSSVKRSYDTSFKYNTVDGLYALANVREFLVSNNIYVLKENLFTNSYVDLLNDDSKLLIGNSLYFDTLIEKLNINYLILTDENLSGLLEKIDGLPAEEEDLKKFIRHIDYDQQGNNYRIIAEYNDKTFATLLIQEGE